MVLYVKKVLRKAKEKEHRKKREKTFFITENITIY